MHGGLTDPRELGRKGGRGRTRSMLGIDDTVAEGRLRAQAKRALEDALQTDNEQVWLRAAQALYSYRAAAPPEERQADGEYAGERMPEGRSSAWST